ncbi:MAG: A/G-specific adenine glycosylase [Alphaproteobacteria bacterium]|nr:A/G-specific adenine glycosylase [Alphaproteobacteria bacterium]
MPKKQQNKAKPARARPVHAGPAASLLLAWYDRHRRVLPWRALPGQRPDPYRVWLAEIMLQQTTVAAVGPYYEKFLQRWPTVGALARAKLDDVMHAWAGLGYYRRARLLHACARAVVADHGGQFPSDEAALRALPGIGAYTAAAVTAIAFGRRANVVDGNVERVMARLFAVKKPLTESKRLLRAHAEKLLPASRFGDYAQALMDLGATVCTPGKPRCYLCPLQGACVAFARGIAAALPARAVKKAKPLRQTTAYWLVNQRGEVLLRRRPPEGLLGGMVEVPSAPWRERGEKQPVRLKKNKDGAEKTHAPARTRWKMLAGDVRHSFTHFDLHIRVAVGKIRSSRAGGSIQGFWVKRGAVEDQGLPSVMRKIARHALAASG